MKSMRQREATNALEILMCGDIKKLKEHFELAKDATNRSSAAYDKIVILANSLKCYYEDTVATHMNQDGWSNDVVHSLALDGLDLIDWNELATRVYFLMER